jgi:hypothetical protein
VAAAGSLVVVAWAADQDDRIRARVSTDRGVHWGSVVTLATTSTTTVSAAARGSRVAVAWTTAEGVVVAVRSGGTWGPARIVAGPVGDQYSPAVALQGTSRVGVAWAQEDTGSSLTTLNWAESPDNGAAWYVPQVIAGTSASRETNDWASIQWPSASTRIVLWNGWTPGTNWYRQFIRTGTGSPAGLPAVAPILAVGASSAHAGATVHRGPSAGHGS